MLHQVLFQTVQIGIDLKPKCILKKWQEQNLEKVKEQNRINSAKGAAKVSKKIKVELETGEVLYYSSKSEFQRKTGQWAKTIIEKTQKGIFYNGYKIWEV